MFSEARLLLVNAEVIPGGPYVDTKYGLASDERVKILAAMNKAAGHIKKMERKNADLAKELDDIRRSLASFAEEVNILRAHLHGTNVTSGTPTRINSKAQERVLELEAELANTKRANGVMLKEIKGVAKR